MVVALKVLLAPLLVAGCTYVVQRWGTTTGGWLLGLPLTSGPVSVLLYLEYGPRFAREAARGSLLGLVAVAAFCSAYVFLATRQPWWRTLLAAYIACVATALALAELHPGFAATIVLVLCLLGMLAWRLASAAKGDMARSSATRGLVVRMVIAAGVVFAVTTSAEALGPSAAGMLAPLPVVAVIMAVSSHATGRSEAARDLLKGVLVGSWGGAAFFVVLGAMLVPGQALGTYAAAIAAAVGAALLAPRIAALLPALRPVEGPLHRVVFVPVRGHAAR